MGRYTLNPERHNRFQACSKETYMSLLVCSTKENSTSVCSSLELHRACNSLGLCNYSQQAVCSIEGLCRVCSR